MPEQVQAELERRVAALVTARRPMLEQLVRDAVDRELQALVDAELDQRANGHANGQRVADPAKPNLRRCTKCERDLPASAYEKHRAVCRECRRQEARDRQTRIAADTEPPRPDPPPQTT